MGTNIYRLALQSGKWGYYAEVELDVTIDSTLNGLEIDIGENCERDWTSAVVFGITYAWEKVRRTIEGCRVVIMEARGYLVDTTQMVMAYGAMNAFWEAVGERPTTMPSLEEENGLFVIPK